MKIQKVKVLNFRLLENFELDFREDISLVVGKNNCGKTSVITIMDKLLGNGDASFSWNDFNLNFQNFFFKNVQNFVDSEDGSLYESKGIKMQVFVEYGNGDSFANIQNYMMDLDPNNNIVVLEFFYSCKEDKIKQLKQDLESSKTTINTFEGFSKYMVKNSSKYFQLQRYSRRFDVETNRTTDDVSGEIKFSEIRKLINVKTIKANREASNKVNDNVLSGLSQKYYDSLDFGEEYDLSELQVAIEKADKDLGLTYNGMKGKNGIFTEVFKSIKKFGSETDVTIQSSISENDLLKSNTTLYYKTEDCQLPESYNGLGYLNLIGIIFEIETIISEFHGKKDDNSSDINMLFIEEPEAHTHPQLQYVFIKNIKELINERKIKDGEEIKIQTIITTHSSHIVSECDFNDVRYLIRKNNSLDSRNFQELKDSYDSDHSAFRFIKKYLNLNRSELFFTDKAIFIEGDTERILLPSMMQKIDREHTGEKKYVPLLSQNISIIEAGAYAHIFKPLIEFLGIKVLVITDIDLAKKKIKRNKSNKPVKRLVGCSSYEEPTHTTNESIKNFFQLKNTDEQYSILISKKTNEKVIKNCRVAYQTKEKNYQASSFEDSFICLNIDYIKLNLDNFTQGLKNKTKLEAQDINYYDIAQECIAKKSAFATEVLYYDGETNGTCWNTPEYIKEGLEWLQK